MDTTEIKQIPPVTPLKVDIQRDVGSRFIQIEGMDGAGKTSFIEALAKTLRIWGKKVIVIRMPGGIVPDEHTTPPFVDGGEDIRRFFLANRKSFHEDSALFLVLAAYRDHLIKTVRPFLDEGGYVLCDRGIATMGAYHNILLHSNQVPAATLVGHQEYLLASQYPVGVYLDVDFETSISRMNRREEDKDVDSKILDITQRDRFEKTRRSMLQMLDSHAILYSKRHRFDMDQIGGDGTAEGFTSFLHAHFIPKVMPDLAAQYLPT